MKKVSTYEVPEHKKIPLKKKKNSGFHGVIIWWLLYKWLWSHGCTGILVLLMNKEKKRCETCIPFFGT